MKTTDKAKQKTADKKPISKNLQAAITGLFELYGHCAVLLGTGKKAALDRVRSYVHGNRERWQEVATGLKDHIRYADMKPDDKQRASNNLRYLRSIVGVAARPTTKRGKKPEHAGKSPIDTQDIANRDGRVILPETGKTQNERYALIGQVLTALDNALGTSRAETVELILLATQQRGARKAA
jgi:hypothetical protein